MADITWADVTALAPELSTVPDAKQAFILARANTELSSTVWGSLLNTGRVYFAAHLASRGGAGGAVGPVVSESVGAVSRSYASPVGLSGDSTSGMQATPYGQEFLALLRTLPGTRFAISPSGCP